MSMFYDILSFLVYVTAGWIGIWAHWLNRWREGRTENDFPDYMKGHKWHTIASMASSAGSAFTLYYLAPPDLTMQLLYGQFWAGYGLDSVVNKDTPKDPSEGRSKDETKSIEDLITESNSIHK